MFGFISAGLPIASLRIHHGQTEKAYSFVKMPETLQQDRLFCRTYFYPSNITEYGKTGLGCMIHVPGTKFDRIKFAKIQTLSPHLLRFSAEMTAFRIMFQLDYEEKDKFKDNQNLAFSTDYLSCMQVYILKGRP